MKTLQNHIVLPLLAIVVVVSLSVSAYATESSNRQISAQTAAQNAGRYGGADSIQYAVWEDGKLTLTGHMGTYSRTENCTLTDDNLYGIGSVSKVYTAAAVMKLVDAGKIQLDAPVARYLPAFKMIDERYKKITVRMLLNHSSGLMGSSDDSTLLFGDNDKTATKTLLEKLSSQRLKADPGAYSVYCNNGYVLAELVVEAVSGTPFTSYIQKELLAPTGLKNTYAPGEGFNASRLVKTYYGTEDTRALPQDCVTEVGVGGLYATASDLAAFGGALSDTKILSKASQDAMSSTEYAKGIWPDDDLDLFSFGLGWDSVKTYPFCQSNIQALAKSGDTLFYHASLVVIPQYHLSAAVVSSGGSSKFNELSAIRMLIDALAQHEINVNEALPTLPAVEKSFMPTEISKSIGYYGSPGQQLKIEISNDGTLTMRNLSYFDAPLQSFYYCGGNSFRSATDPKQLVKFLKESNGQQYLYEKYYESYPELGTIPWSQYIAMKLPENTVSKETQAAWNAAYFAALPVNEKYTSQAYAQIAPQDGMEKMIPTGIPGYVECIRIIDDTHAQYIPQIPELAGRDGTDLVLTKKNGKTYLTANAKVYLYGKDVPDIYTADMVYSTILPDGYARWYRVGNSVGKVMTVTVPKNGGFYVYNAGGKIVASSVMWNDTKISLPSKGYIVFSGDVGDRFLLQFSPAN